MRKKLRNENQKVKSTVHHIIFTYPLKTNCFLALFLYTLLVYHFIFFHVYDICRSFILSYALHKTTSKLIDEGNSSVQVEQATESLS